MARVRHPSTLVLVDLHEQSIDDVASNHAIIPALINCNLALSHGRAIGMQVAFVRRVAAMRPSYSDDHGPRWIQGFMPRPSEMVFDRERASCYASKTFSDVMNRANHEYALCGLFNESESLMTIVDAFHRNHRVTYLADASACLVTGKMRSYEVHRALLGIIGQFNPIAETREWIRATTLQVEEFPTA
jgi:nicotinamidase-related amidase